METILVILIVAFAAGYLIWRFWSGSKQDASCDCGCCPDTEQENCRTEKTIQPQDEWKIPMI